MKMRSISSGLQVLIVAILLALSSCNKDAPFGIVAPEQPPPGVSAGQAQIISEKEDTVALKVIFKGSGEYNPERYKYQWTCTEFPPGASEPVIEKANGFETIARGLQKGRYVFNVKVSNRKGSSQANLEVNVMQDDLSGKFITLSDQLWQVFNRVNSPIQKPIYVAQIQTSPERPDLFFRKVAGMEVQYKNEGDQSWRTFDGFTIRVINEFRSLEVVQDNVPGSLLVLNNSKLTLRIYFR